MFHKKLIGDMALSNNDKTSSNGFLLGLTLGAAVGFLSGVLFAPKPGNETRAIIMDTGREWKEKAEEITSTTREKLSKATAKGKKTITDLHDDGFNDLDLDDEDL